MDDKYAIDIIASGAFVDKGVYVKTLVFRANGAARNGWIDSEPWMCRAEFKTSAEYYEYCKSCRSQRREWEKEIVRLLDTAHDPDSVSITQNVSEIYTAVLMTEVRDE